MCFLADLSKSALLESTFIRNCLILTLSPERWGTLTKVKEIERERSLWLLNANLKVASARKPSNWPCEMLQWNCFTVRNKLLVSLGRFIWFTSHADKVDTVYADIIEATGVHSRVYVHIILFGRWTPLAIWITIRSSFLSTPFPPFLPVAACFSFLLFLLEDYSTCSWAQVISLFESILYGLVSWVNSIRKSLHVCKRISCAVLCALSKLFLQVQANQQLGKRRPVKVVFILGRHQARAFSGQRESIWSRLL